MEYTSAYFQVDSQNILHFFHLYKCPWVIKIPLTFMSRTSHFFRLHCKIPMKGD